MNQRHVSLIQTCCTSGRRLSARRGGHVQKLLKRSLRTQSTRKRSKFFGGVGGISNGFTASERIREKLRNNRCFGDVASVW
ncbi:hypothetical protein GN956_G12039 [Arapaima gigas]